MSRTIGMRIKLRNDLHNTHGDWYWPINGKTATVVQVDPPDEDGECVYGVKIGKEFFTVTSSMIA